MISNICFIIQAQTTEKHTYSEYYMNMNKLLFYYIKCTVMFGPPCISETTWRWNNQTVLISGLSLYKM